MEAVLGAAKIQLQKCVTSHQKRAVGYRAHPPGCDNTPSAPQPYLQRCNSAHLWLYRHRTASASLPPLSSPRHGAEAPPTPQQRQTRPACSSLPPFPAKPSEAASLTELIRVCRIVKADGTARRAPQAPAALRGAAIAEASRGAGAHRLL